MTQNLAKKIMSSILNLLPLIFTISVNGAPGVHLPQTSSTQTASLISKTSGIKAITNPVKLRVEKNDTLAVKGYHGQFIYFVDEKRNDITIEVSEDEISSALKYRDEWQFIFKRQGQELQVYIDGPLSKQIWNEILASGEAPRFFLKITGPSMPLTVVWNEGHIAVEEFNADIAISAQKAHINVSQGIGDVSINNIDGTIKVNGRKGAVSVDSYLAVATIEGIEGQLKLENFTGESNVRGINGNVDLSTYRGSTRLADIKGRLEFKNGISPLYIEKFEGELRGRSGQGSVFADVRGKADIRLESAEGTVNLRLPASGAWVNVGTEEGSLTVPSFLKLTQLQTRKIRTGRLRGSQSGSVFVRTTTGDIRVK